MKAYSVSEYGKYLKRKMMMARIFGIAGCLLGLLCIVLYGLQRGGIIEEAINDWMLLVMLTYCMANAFTYNSGLQGAKSNNPWQRVNALSAIFFYLFVIFLLAYGIASGYMI